MYVYVYETYTVCIDLLLIRTYILSFNETPARAHTIAHKYTHTRTQTHTDTFIPFISISVLYILSRFR